MEDTARVDWCFVHSSSLLDSQSIPTLQTLAGRCLVTTTEVKGQSDTTCHCIAGVADFGPNGARSASNGTTDLKNPIFVPLCAHLPPFQLKSDVCAQLWI